MHRYSLSVCTPCQSARPTSTAEIPPDHRPPSSLQPGPDRPLSSKSQPTPTRVLQHLRAVCNRVSPWSALFRRFYGPRTTKRGPGPRGNGPAPPHGSGRGGKYIRLSPLGSTFLSRPLRSSRASAVPPVRARRPGHKPPPAHCPGQPPPDHERPSISYLSPPSVGTQAPDSPAPNTSAAC